MTTNRMGLEQALSDGCKVVYGVAINDSALMRPGKRGGITGYSAAYQTWIDMIKRCYEDRTMAHNPSYRGCETCKEWLLFSGFYKWWIGNHVDGWQLDKDLLNPGNKIYGPQKCLYIPRWLNSFTTSKKSNAGRFPTGVSYCSQTKKFKSAIRIDGKKKTLGYFTDPQSAHNAWFVAKITKAKEYKSICDDIHKDLYRGLIGTITSMHLSEARHLKNTRTEKCHK